MVSGSRMCTMPTVPKHDPLTCEDKEKLKNFFGKHPKLFIITGAGVSTQSGLLDHKSEGVGLYARNPTYSPTKFSKFLGSAEVRRRIWARNAVTWDKIYSKAKPNITHNYFSTLENTGKLHWLVTLNLDNLHYKAGSRRLTEFHGNFFSTACLDCKLTMDRYEFQELILKQNQGWSPKLLKLGPDGDYIISEEEERTFVIPDCPNCSGGRMMPNAVMYGDNVPNNRIRFAHHMLGNSDAMIIVGTSLSTRDSRALVKHARGIKLPIMMINIGDVHKKVRGIPEHTVNANCGDVFEWMLKQKIY